jgi:ZIP family zinc transporter
VGEALLWGSVAASSLVLGAVLGLRLRLSRRALGLFLGLGAGALIAGVSFELAGEALEVGGFRGLGLGLAAGALAFYLGHRALDRLGRRRQGRPRSHEADAAGSHLAFGALLDGIPEQAALGMGLVAGGEVGLALLAAVFLSNVPEALGSAAAMQRAGHSVGAILRLWLLVAAVCVAATVVGYLALDGAPATVTAIVLGFAAGAVLVMLVDAMVPEAVCEGGQAVGLVTVLGFALAVLVHDAGT